MWASLHIADVALYTEGYVVEGFGYISNTFVKFAIGKLKLLLIL